MVTLQGGIVQQQYEIDDLPLDAAIYYFDIISEHSISLQSNITDNWMENNTVINDHIANQPVTISLSGIKGELTYRPNDYTTLSYLSMAETQSETTLTSKLGKLVSLYPPIDSVTKLAMNAKDYVEASYNRYKGIAKTLFKNNNYNSTFGLLDTYLKKPVNFDHPQIRRIYNRFETMRELKAPFEVITPYKTFKNMYIQSLTLRQGNQLFTTDIEITFKQAYFTDTLTTQADKAVLDKYSNIQRAEVENHGKVQGNKSLLKSATEKKNKKWFWEKK